MTHLNDRMLDYGSLDAMTVLVFKQWLAAQFADISEKAYCAGWIHDLEYYLWEGVLDLPHDLVFGMTTIPADRLEKIKMASERIGLWLHWDSEKLEEKFVDLEEWKTQYDQWTASRR